VLALPAQPYYSDDHVTLYHGDSTELRRHLPMPGLLVLDPPFDEWENVPAMPAKTVVAFTTWQHRGHVEDRYGRPRAELIWSFDDGRWVSHTLPRITHETIMVYGPTGSAYVGDPNNEPPQRKGAGHVGRDAMPDRVYVPRDRRSIDSVLRYPRNVSGPLGVWTKPLPLVQRLIQWAHTGGLIVDPYAGSGTTLVAAKALGLQAVGIEIDERACEIAANRCRQDVLGLVVS
jgi:site-specific DNA-methyltransferase (adenine-specific)